ncbi:MAG TPA: hypothetical protein DCQ29_01220 [Chitinophagaceae bacterium]|nr:hypothetical protein [Chitinophagaceae bacterium]
MDELLLKIQSNILTPNASKGFTKRFAKPLFWLYLAVYLTYVALTLYDWLVLTPKSLHIFLRLMQIALFAILLYHNGRQAFGYTQPPATNSYLQITSQGIHFLNFGSTTPEFSPFATISKLVVGEHTLRIKHHHQADAVFYFEGISINDREALRAWIQEHASAFITTP